MPKEHRNPSNVHRASAAQAPVATTAAGGTGGAGGRTVASTWTAADDEVLMAARAQGLNWQPIATKHFPAKTPNACRKRHERLMERQKADGWDGDQLERLATEYMTVRREMWKLLADRVGEKWGIVEAKCMEKGLKNLQSACRSAQRKERGMDGDDSGIGFSDAENDLDDGGSGVGGGSVGAGPSPPTQSPSQQAHVPPQQQQQHPQASAAAHLHQHPPGYLQHQYQPRQRVSPPQLSPTGQEAPPRRSSGGVSIQSMLSPSPADAPT